MQGHEHRVRALLGFCSPANGSFSSDKRCRAADLHVGGCCFFKGAYISALRKSIIHSRKNIAMMENTGENEQY